VLFIDGGHGKVALMGMHTLAELGLGQMEVAVAQLGLIFVIFHSSFFTGVVRKVEDERGQSMCIHVCEESIMANCTTLM
jgi:hypothetical protein